MDGNNINYVSPDELEQNPPPGAELEEGCFLIATLYREDIDQALESEGIAPRDGVLTDKLMHKIAEKLNSDYLNQLFWSSLREAAHALLQPEDFVSIPPERTDLPYEEYYDGG